ncbi:hypothetical protein ELY33_06990 [Vreelandella andesensis]|uniref:Molecular chaperone n=1 Tax=Vreelandella andesensis TaxID=447567 RepID=A0A3S1DQN5_9GAMM|nr:hypothetical protein [Halomonas andesensis]RUR31952.1 hypothetical protein ELY33_06990 [Halomonas andesensis]
MTIRRFLTISSIAFCFFCYSTLLAGNTLKGQVGISPQNFIVDLDNPGKVHAYRLMNMGQSPIRIEVDLMSFELDEDNQVVPIVPTETSLENWIIVNPLELTIPPGDSQVVRFSIRPAIALPEGEHRTAMIFQQLPTTEEELPIASSSDASMVFKSLFRLQTAIYATVGHVERTGHYHDVRLSGNSLWIQVENTGNGHVRLSGDWALWPASQYSATQGNQWLDWLELTNSDRQANPLTPPPARHGQLSANPVMPNAKRWLRIPIGESLQPGRYHLELKGQLSDSPIQISTQLQVGSAVR